MPELVSDPEQDWVLVTPVSGRRDAGIAPLSAESTGSAVFLTPLWEGPAGL